MHKNLFEEFIYLREVSRWVGSISRDSGKSSDEVQRIWKDTEKEVVSPLHKGGITDNLRQVSKIVKQKVGLAKSDDSKSDPSQDDSEKEKIKDKEEE